jgi:hypothetical protein
MMGCIRLYIEPRETVPDHMRSRGFVPIIDCNPDQARDLKRRLQRQGYEVIAVPL